MNGQILFYGVLAGLAFAGVVFLIVLVWSLSRMSTWLEEQDRRLLIKSRNNRK